MLEAFHFLTLHMFRFFSRPARLVLALTFYIFIPVLSALVLVFQIPTGTYPEDSSRLAVAPISWFAHVLAGAAFGITGLVQFFRALRHRFGALHRVSGRIFVLSGAILGLSSLSLLAQVTSERTHLVDVARVIFGLALLIALTLAMAAIRTRDFPRHRAWAIRAYSIGMGLGTVSLVFFPIYIITGQPPTGLASDILFVASWLLTIAFAELVIRYISKSTRGPARRFKATQPMVPFECDERSQATVVQKLPHASSGIRQQKIFQRDSKSPLQQLTDHDLTPTSSCKS
jgi:hypothetical protein